MTETARAYASALYGLAQDESAEGEILSQLKTAAELFGENPDYVTLLSAPSIPKAERCALLDESFGARVHPYLLSTMKLLTEQCAVRELPRIAEAYRALYNDAHGIAEATVYTAQMLTEAELAALREKLEARTGKTVLLRTRLTPDALGGLCVEIDGCRYDGTLKNRLTRVSRLLRDTVL